MDRAADDFKAIRSRMQEIARGESPIGPEPAVPASGCEAGLTGCDCEVRRCIYCTNPVTVSGQIGVGNFIGGIDPNKNLPDGRPVNPVPVADECWDFGC